MKEGLQLNFPPALFLLLVILRSYVQNIPLQEDKKVRKELQVNMKFNIALGGRGAYFRIDRVGEGGINCPEY